MTAPLWTLDEIIKATNATLIGTQAPGSAPIRGINFDSRSVEPGDLFLAMKGERDGHEFVMAAKQAGAVLALTEKPVSQMACLIVPDVQKALEAMGRFSRFRATSAKRCAVTGSVGKTSVTQMIYGALQGRGPAHGSIKSFNNHIGVPLTLARMPRETEAAVFEIGMNHAGEIAALVKQVGPHVGIITNVGPVHTENFPDGELGVMKAKAELFTGIVREGAAVISADHAWFDDLVDLAHTAGLSVYAYGEFAGTDAYLTGHHIEGEKAIINAFIHGEKRQFRLNYTAKHQALNALGTLLVLEQMGLSLDEGEAALDQFQPLEGRGRIVKIRAKSGQATLIDESYNANPVSMRATIETLGSRAINSGGRRIAVLTDMLELGIDQETQHADLSDLLQAQKIDKVYCAGPLMKHLWDNLPQSMKGEYADKAETLIEPVRDALQADDIVLVKGSNGSLAHTIAKALQAA